MALLSISKIQEGLDKEFESLEPMLDGYRLKKSGLEESEIVKCESTLSVKFPQSFRGFLSDYDLGNLTIGPIAFCATGNYPSELIEYNDFVAWWGSGFRPRKFVMVANSDPYAIILNVDNGGVYIFDPELSLDQINKISEDFQLFVRGVGSTILLRNTIDNKNELAQSIHDAVGSEHLEYWIALSK